EFCATGRRRLQSAPAWARLRAMSSRARLNARLALATIVLPALAFAQDSIVPFGQEDSPRAHLRDRYRKPENSQKLSDSVRKLKSEDVEERLDAIRTLGQIDDPKATEALVAAASDLDMRVRIKAIDALGHVKAKDATPLLVQQLFMRDTDLGTTQRLGDEAAQEALLSQALQAHAPPEVLRDARVQVHQDIGVVPSKPMRERHWEAPNV